MSQKDKANLILFENYLKIFILMYFRDSFRQIGVRGQNVDKSTLKVLIQRLKSDIKEDRHLILKQTVDELKNLDLSDVIFSDLNSDVKCMLIKEMDESSKYRNNVIKLVNEIINDLKVK